MTFDKMSSVIPTPGEAALMVMKLHHRSEENSMSSVSEALQRALDRARSSDGWATLSEGDLIAAIEALRSSAPRTSEEWRPIETAPKDGGYIIAGRFGRSEELIWVKQSRWITAREIADDFGGEADEYEDAWTDGDDDSEPCYPTHWMPLTAPSRIANTLDCSVK